MIDQAMQTFAHGVESMEIERIIETSSRGEDYLTIRLKVVAKGMAYETSFFTVDKDMEIELKGFENGSKDG